MIDKEHKEEWIISMILRLAVASVFGVAAYGKFAGGLDNYTAHMSAMFQNTFLPGFLLTPYINILPFAECLIVVWLLTGFKLRYAWAFAACVLWSLAFGMVVVQNGAVALGNFVYMLMACLGVYLSKYDHCVLGGCCCKK